MEETLCLQHTECLNVHVVFPSSKFTYRPGLLVYTNENP